MQLDFQQPQNFSLEYQTGDNPAKVAVTSAPQTDALPRQSDAPADANAEKDGDKAAKSRFLKKPVSAGCARPVMIHRAMAGSIERFTAILCEHFAGKWPFWLSPRQVQVVPVGMGFLDYAKEVQQILKRKFGFQHCTAISSLGTNSGTPQAPEYMPMLTAAERRCKKRSEPHSCSSTTSASW